LQDANVGASFGAKVATAELGSTSTLKAVSTPKSECLRARNVVT
jgi:hypothetical protein